MRDISPQKQAEAKVRASEASLVQAQSIARIGNWDWDISTDELYWSAQVFELFGLNTAESKSTYRRFLNGVHPEDRERTHQAVMAAVAGTAPYSIDHRVVWPDGTVRWMHEQGEATRDAGGRALNMTGTVQDITERKQAEEVLRVNEERFRLLARATNDAIWDWNLLTDLLWWNEGYETLFGYARAEVDPTIKSWTDYIHPEDLARVSEKTTRVIEHGGEGWSDEYRFRCKDGRYAHVLDRGHVIRDAAGRPVRMIGGMTDLTKLKEHEIALSQSNRALQLFSRCNEALIRSETESGLLAAICQIAVDIGGFRLAWVGYAIEDADRTIECQSHAGVEDGYLSTVRITWAENDPAGQGPAGRVIRHGEPVVIPDLETDESFRPWLESARAHGFRGVIALPLTDKQRTFGVLVLYLAEVRQPLLDEMRLLRELADDMVFGVVTIRTRLDRRRLNTAVAQVATSVSAARSTFFFEQLTRCMVTALGAKAGFVAKVLPGEPVTSLTIAVVVDDQVTPNFDYVVQGSPCENFFASDTCVIHEQVARKFPLTPSLAALGAEGFVGRRLDSTSGTFIGQMAVIFREPLKDVDFVVSALQIFSARAAAELERQETDTKLREQAALLDKARDAIFVRDLNHKILYWNHGAERLYGWSAAEALDRDIRELIYRDADALEAAFVKLMDTDESVREMEYVTKEGRVVIVERRCTLVRDEHGDPQSVLSINTDITERKAAELAVQRSEERFRELAENIREVFWMTDPAKNELIYISPAYETIWGRTCASLQKSPGRWLDAIHLDDRARVLDAAATKQVRGDYDEEYRIQRPDGTVRWIHDRAFPVRGAAGEILRVVGTAEDITERRQLEEQLRQSQKMEAIGLLAGGIAHDFNNILAVMMMQVDLTGMAENLPNEVEDGLREIRAAAERAASLTRQLLLFSRKQVMQSSQLDLNEVVTNLVKMLQRLIGGDVRLQLNLHPRPLITHADAGMLEQVLMNLVVNARDAMPDGGQLFIETSENIFTAAEAAMIPDAVPGRYVCLRVIDTGSGMPPEILSRIFEPFFTTKAPGKGTGLGLATVFGIIKQHNGALTVESEVGKGTTFRLLLRAEEVPAKSRGKEPANPQPRGGTETVLLVEDEPSVRMLTRVVLERSGYQVFESAHGVEALNIWEREAENIQLLLTDIVLPEGISGRELAVRLREKNPKLRVIFTSGYSADVAGREMSLKEGQNFIQKPASPRQLLETVRCCLDA